MAISLRSPKNTALKRGTTLESDNFSNTAQYLGNGADSLYISIIY